MSPTHGRIVMLRIEVDGHFHGSPVVPRPWVARLDGPDSVYGLSRTFVQRLSDLKDARVAHSGNLYGVVATFPLRDGGLYEVSRLRGKPSRRHVAREFWRVDAESMTELHPLDALAAVEKHENEVMVLRVAHNPHCPPRVAEIAGPGEPLMVGYVVVDEVRLYRLRRGHLYEVREEVDGQLRRKFVGVDEELINLSQQEAVRWLARSA